MLPPFAHLRCAASKQIQQFPDSQPPLDIFLFHLHIITIHIHRSTCLSTLLCAASEPLQLLDHGPPLDMLHWTNLSCTPTPVLRSVQTTSTFGSRASKRRSAATTTCDRCAQNEHLKEAEAYTGQWGYAHAATSCKAVSVDFFASGRSARLIHPQSDAAA